MQRSAGTFARFEQARKAGVDAQARVLDGRFLDQARGSCGARIYDARLSWSFYAVLAISMMSSGSPLRSVVVPASGV